ncbi:hypothetical protein BJV74DRAFT_864527 [Russula compacta]|nr:hypothetical protein BJV74DRAFT_864527 [Russula compacta]
MRCAFMATGLVSTYFILGFSVSTCRWAVTRKPLLPETIRLFDNRRARARPQAAGRHSLSFASLTVMRVCVHLFYHYIT